MTPWAASIDNAASSAHLNHEVQTSRENNHANENKNTPHFYYFQMAYWPHAVARVLSDQKSDQ
jgi:hypothetical protein